MATGKRLTVGRLYKALKLLVEQGKARVPVCVEKDSFTHPLEQDGCTIIDVNTVDLLRINIVDDDGGMKMRQDGSECLRQTLVLFGERKFIKKID